MAHLLIADLITFKEGGAESIKSMLLNRRADLPHQGRHKVHVVDCAQPQGTQFPGFI